MSVSAPHFEHQHYCKKCGYDLHGLESHHCPECGQWFNSNIPSTYESEPPSFRRSLRRNMTKIKISLVVLGLLFIVVVFGLPIISSAVRFSGPPSWANMPRLSEACLFYAEKHDGYFPENLGALYQEGLIEMRACKRPRGHTDWPPEHLTKDQGAAWINEHSDYVYIQPLPELPQNNPRIMLFEKTIFEKWAPGSPPQIMVIFSDGNMSYLPKDVFFNNIVKLLQQHNDATTQPNSSLQIEKKENGEQSLALRN